MKSKLLFSAILVSGLMLVNFSVNQAYGQTPQNKPVKPQTAKYTCPMHPEVEQDRPGKCPKCGMVLVRNKDMKKGTYNANDSLNMEKDHMKMRRDSTNMKKGHMMKDTTLRNKDYMKKDTTMRKKIQK